MTNHWKSADFVFQLTNDELPMLAGGQKEFLGNDGIYHKSIIESFVFITIELDDDNWGRGKLAAITREINKLFPMPAIIFFRYGNKFTLSLIPRRQNKIDSSRDVIEPTRKVSLIKDVDISMPHRAHVNILADLHILARIGKKAPSNFTDLYQNWTEVLSVEALNKKFYNKLSNWYLWSVDKVVFPVANSAGDDGEKLNQIAIIRLLTRLIFVWFIKEKGLVPEKLFDRKELARLLSVDPSDNPDDSGFYKAVLQNLFFATLNTEQNDMRKWRSRSASGSTSDYLVTTKYRYKNLFADPDTALSIFHKIPFLNGGLFECLDHELSDEDIERNPELGSLATTEGRQLVLRADGFSERKENTLHVPNEIFFGREISADLNAVYGTKGKQYTVDGLINIFESYKFTVEENTPYEEEVALDPELLGKVFENLIASFNADTKTNARKKSGSFYTSRVVLDYMVDEALTGYLGKALLPTSVHAPKHGVNETLDLGPGSGELDLTSSNAAQTDTVLQRRDRAFLAFLFLTGSREGAAITIRLQHVDLNAGCVHFDGKTVNTKFGKSFTTSFFPFGSTAEQILHDWIDELQKQHLFGKSDPLFPKTKVGLGTDREFTAIGITREPWASPSTATKIFKSAFADTGFPPFSPHLVRDMIIELASDFCRTPEEFKAWSQNMGHEDVLLSFRAYGSVATGRQMELL